MSASVKGRLDWSMERDEKGHRTYTLKLLVRTTSILDGPLQVMLASGMPLVGSPWSFGNDVDPWAFCRPEITVERISGLEEGEPGRLWTVELTFSTKPLTRCQDTSIENPLEEPMGISGSFTRFTKLTTKDRNGRAIVTSSHEPVPVERDYNRATVKITQNVASLGLDVFSEMVDHVNDAPIWGLDKRCVKLSNVSWSRKLYGTCTFYYTREFDFEVRFESFDRDDILDQGHKVVDGKWQIKGAGPDWEYVPTPGIDVDDPGNFRQATDPQGNLIGPVPLDGLGGFNSDPWNGPVHLPTARQIARGAPDKIQIYPEANFLLLGIPTTL